MAMTAPLDNARTAAVLVKETLFHKEFGINAGFPRSSLCLIQKGNAIKSTRLVARRALVEADRMDAKSALIDLKSFKLRFCWAGVILTQEHRQVMRGPYLLLHCLPSQLCGKGH